MVVHEHECLAPQDDPLQHGKHVGVEQAPHVSRQVGDRLARFHRIAECPARSHRVECVARGEDAPANGDVLPDEASRVARSIIVLMVVLDVGERDRHVLEWREDLHADAHMFLHVRKFFGRERARLVQHGFADADLANVVQAARQTDVLDYVGVQTERVPEQS